MNTVIVDYEFTIEPGELPKPLCYVARFNGKTVRHWIKPGDKKPLYPVGKNTVVIGFGVSSEILCHLVLRFPIPRHVIDLYAEFRNMTNGKPECKRASLIQACEYYGIKTISKAYKETMRNKIIQGGPFTDRMKEKILDYCESDVDMTEKLYKQMPINLDSGELSRGDYSVSVAQMEYNGIPINAELYRLIYASKSQIRKKFIDDYIKANPKAKEIFNAKDQFNFKKFEAYLNAIGLLSVWPRTDTGRLTVNQDALETMALEHPEIQAFLELRQIIGKLNLLDLQVGKDDRARCQIRPFASETGRNQPSSSQYVFGNSRWVRNFIKPKKGMAIAYLDYEQQEIAIAAALSGDKNLQNAYSSGDPYLAFGKLAKLIPPRATKKTHKKERETFKRLMLATNYGMAVTTFAKVAGISLDEADELRGKHVESFPGYWDFIYEFIERAELEPVARTTLGWKCLVYGKPERFLMNWPMQSHGSEMLRVAINHCLRNGIKVCGPVHDAILIEAPAKEIQNAVKVAKECMIAASKQVINFPVRVEAKVIRYPGHFTEDTETWNRILSKIRSDKNG